MSPFKYTHHSPPLIANCTRTRTSATQCSTDTAPAALSAPHTPRSISGRAVVVLIAPVLPDIQPALVKQALSGTHIQLAAGTPPPLCTRDSSSTPCPRPTAPCSPPIASISPAGGAVATTETSADRLSSSSRTLQALWEQPRCRTCAHHHPNVRADMRHVIRPRHSPNASLCPPRPTDDKWASCGGAQSTSNVQPRS